MGEAAENLETQPANEIPDSTSEFAKIVEESQRKLNEEKAEPRRGRGRPPGGAKEGTYYHRKRYGSDAGASAETETPTQGSVGAAPASDQFPDLSEEFAVPFLTLSQIPARRHGIPELAFTPEEATACGQSVQKILNAFAPEMSRMDPKTAAVVGACVTLGTITMSKVMIYSQAKSQIVEMQRMESTAAGDGRTDTPQFEPTPQQREEQAKMQADIESKKSFFPMTSKL